MKMPSKGSPIVIDGYGRGIFVGGHKLDDPDEAEVLLKFEGIIHFENGKTINLNKGYGRGIIPVPLEEYKENRVHTDQLPKRATPDISTEKRDELLKQQIEE